MNKIFFEEFFKSIFKETFEIKFWDGSSKIIGKDDIKFKIILNTNIPKKEILRDPFLTFGEAYMNRDLELEGDIQEIIELIYINKDSFLNKASLFEKLYKVVPNSVSKSKDNAQYHYDLGNDFYKLWLDKTMSYSCAYFKNKEDTLYDAQLNKTEYALKKLNLKQGETLLDIGCGWGELVIMASKKYGANALGITLSEEQWKVANERIKENNLEDKATVKLMDYRELLKTGQKFDKVISVGMIEHVGRKNIPQYMETFSNLLNDEGVGLLHCITAQKEAEGNQWIKKYIFPGGYIPSIREIVHYMPDNNLHLIDLESLRLHYAKTLECWKKNFINALDEVKKTKDDKFIRMWTLYLASCAASFKHGVIDIHQFLFTKGLNNNIPMTREYMYK